MRSTIICLILIIASYIFIVNCQHLGEDYDAVDSSDDLNPKVNPSPKLTTKSINNTYKLMAPIEEEDETDENKERLKTLSEDYWTPSASDGFTPKVNPLPKITTRTINSTYVLMAPFGEKDDKQKFKFSRLNSTHDRYQANKVQLFKLLPGEKANNPLMRVGKVIGAIPIVKRGLGVSCWDDIGCFSAINSQNGLQKIGMLPMSPKQIGVKFFVYTSKSQEKSFELDYNFDINLLKKSSFNESHQTIIIIHGYKSSLSDWMIEIKNTVYNLKYNNYNVILIDWRKGSDILNYILAASNTRVVGALTAFFINRICETTYKLKMKNDMFYLIGHSLGAHIMGFAAKRLYKPKISRITGLDPAGPLFELYAPDLRLNYNDATLVDIIHTDMAESVVAGLGIFQPIGDMDFYPNGGQLQPGCPQTKMIDNILKYRENISCSHLRSHELMRAFGKVDSYCLPIGYICKNWQTFIEGRCVNCDLIDDISQCQLMGLYPTYWKNSIIDNKPGTQQKYYLNTAKDGDLCVYHYQMAFHISPNSNARSTGELELVLESEVLQQRKFLTINRVISRIFPGKIHTLLVTFKFKVKIKSLSIRWLRLKRKTTFGQKIKIKLVEINYLSHITERVRRSLSVVLCPVSEQSKRPVLFPYGEEIIYDVCEDKSLPDISALNYQVGLVPLTSSINILTVDYENEDFIQEKLNKTDL